MVMAKRPVYKPNIPEIGEELSALTSNAESEYKNHLFDIPEVTKSRKRKWCKDISHGMAPLKGVKSVRDKGNYHIDESTVMPNLLPPIPQTKQDEMF